MEQSQLSVIATHARGKGEGIRQIGNAIINSVNLFKLQSTKSIEFPGCCQLEMVCHLPILLLVSM